jgi:predicted DNA-binding transcriptional regulator
MLEIPQSVKHSLKNIGFDMAQIQTIFFLFKESMVTIADIATGVALPRSTIHLAVETLIERGVLGATVSGKRRHIYIENPEKIRKYIEHEELIAQKKLSEFELLLPELRNFFALRGDSEKIDIEHLEGEDGFVEVFYRSLDQEKGGEVIRMSGNPEKFTVARERLKDYRTQRVKKKIFSRILMTDSPLIEGEKEDALIRFREVRSLPIEQFNPNLQISLWKGHVAMTIWDRGLHSIIITNKSIYDFMKMMFEIAWGSAR